MAEAFSGGFGGRAGEEAPNSKNDVLGECQGGILADFPGFHPVTEQIGEGGAEAVVLLLAGSEDLRIECAHLKHQTVQGATVGDERCIGSHGMQGMFEYGECRSPFGSGEIEKHFHLRGKPFPDHRQYHPFFGGEMVIHGALGGIGIAEDRGRRGTMVAVAVDVVKGGIEETVAGGGCGFHVNIVPKRQMVYPLHKYSSSFLQLSYEKSGRILLQIIIGVTQ